LCILNALSTLTKEKRDNLEIKFFKGKDTKGKMKKNKKSM
jgi:hypothetical protein